MDNFIRKKLTFYKLDGTDFNLSDYYKVVSEFEINPEEYVQCDEFIFSHPIVEGKPLTISNVIFPKVNGSITFKIAKNNNIVKFNKNIVSKLDESKHIKNVSSTVKKSKPFPKVPDEFASELEKKQYERKIVMGNFNDRKITFYKLDGTDFTLKDFYKVVSGFKINPKEYVQCDEFSFKNPVIEDEPLTITNVIIPKFNRDDIFSIGPKLDEEIVVNSESV